MKPEPFRRFRYCSFRFRENKIFRFYSNCKVNKTTKGDTIKLNQKWRMCGTTMYTDDCCVHANNDRELAMTEKSMNNEQSE